MFKIGCKCTVESDSKKYKKQNIKKENTPFDMSKTVHKQCIKNTDPHHVNGDCA